jgi:hypothetical protein
MMASEWASLGVFAGTMIGFACTKKRDFRTGLSVGIGIAVVVAAFLGRLF